MSWGAFTDRINKPEMPEALETMKDCRSSFERLTAFIENNFDVRGEFKFYGRNYGWAFRYMKSGKALVAVYPGKGEFTAQVILDHDQTVDALHSDVSDTVKALIADTPEIHEGRWIFIRVDNEMIVGDIKKLITIRAKKRGKLRGSKG